MSSSTSKHVGKKNSRMKSGCFTCRIRRKKCDEQPDEQGNCQTCVRLRLQCLGFGAKRPDWMREGSNVADMREKIKSFLASNGMIKGHSTAPGDDSMPTMEISPQEASPPRPVASTSMQPTDDTYPPGPPSSASESGSRSSSSTSMPPITTLVPPGPQFHETRNELPYSLRGSQTPYQSRDTLSPITPASISSQLSPPPVEAGTLHGRHGNNAYHASGEGAASILGLSGGRQTGERRTAGSPSSSSGSGSSGLINTNGHGHTSRETDNALGISVNHVGTRASTRHTSSQSPQQFRCRTHTASNAHSLTSSLQQYPVLLSAMPSERSLDFHHPSVDHTNPSSSAMSMSLLSSPSLASVSSLSNACSPRSTTNVPITPSDPHPSLMPSHYNPDIYTFSPSPTTATPTTNNPSLAMPDFTPHSDLTYLTEPSAYIDATPNVPSPDINYSSTDSIYDLSIGATSTGAIFTISQQSPWPLHLHSTLPSIVKHELISPRLVNGSELTDPQTYVTGAGNGQYITGLGIGLGLDVGTMSSDMINDSGLSSFSHDMSSFSNIHHGPSNVDPVSITSDPTYSTSPLSAWDAAGSDVAIAPPHLYTQQGQYAQVSPTATRHVPLHQPNFSPTESRREIVRNDPMLGQVSYGQQQPSFALTSTSPAIGVRDMHSTEYSHSGYESAMGTAMVGHGQASNSQYPGHPHPGQRPTHLRALKDGASPNETSGDFSAQYNMPGTPMSVSRPIGAHGFGMALGGIGQSLDAQGPNILDQSDGEYINPHLHVFTSPMYRPFEPIERNNSYDSPPVVTPKPSEPHEAETRSRATFTAFTNTPQEGELDLMLAYNEPMPLLFFPRGGMPASADTAGSSGMLFTDDQTLLGFTGLTNDDQQGRLEHVYAPSYGLPDPQLEANHPDANLVKYYIEYVQPMQYFFVEGQVLEQIKEFAITHPLLRDAICAVASVHQKRKRQALPFIDLGQGFNTNMLPEAGLGEDDNGYKARAQAALMRLAYSASVATQNAQGGKKVTRLQEVDALAGLECVSIFLFEGGLGDWNVFLAIACDWVESILLKSSETAEQSGKDLWEVLANIEDDLQRFVIRTTMWFEVLASITQMRKPRFFEYYRVLFGQLAPSRFQDVEDASYLLLNEKQGQKKREERRDQRFSMLEVMGCDNTTFLAIAEISALSAWKEEELQNGCLSAIELVKRGIDIESRYLSRVSPAAASFGAGADNQQARRGYTAAIFYSAAKLYLHTVLSGDNPSVFEIRTYVRETVEALERVPVSPPKLRTSIIRSVVFPICIAGCMTEEFEPETSLSPHSMSSKNSPPVSTLGKRSRSSTQSSIATHDYRRSLLNILSDEARGAGNCGEVVKIMQEVWDLRDKAKRDHAELERQKVKRVRFSGRAPLREEHSSSSYSGEVNWRQVLRNREAALLLV